MPFTVNKSFWAVTVVQLIEATAFSCSQVRDTAPLSAIEGEALYILNRKLINALFSLTHATSVVLLSRAGPVSQSPLMTLQTSVLCELFSSWVLSSSQWMFITVTACPVQEGKVPDEPRILCPFYSLSLCVKWPRYGSHADSLATRLISEIIHQLLGSNNKLLAVQMTISRAWMRKTDER